MTGHKIKLTSFRLDKKTGKPVRNIKRLNASAQIAARNSKKVRVKK